MLKISNIFPYCLSYALPYIFSHFHYLSSDWPAVCKICMQVKKQQLELDMEQQTDSKLEKDYVKAVYCHTAYLTFMKSTSWETLDWMKHKL